MLRQNERKLNQVANCRRLRDHDDLVQRLTHADKKGLTLLPARILETQVAPVLPPRKELGHGLSTRLLLDKKGRGTGVQRLIAGGYARAGWAPAGAGRVSDRAHGPEHTRPPAGGAPASPGHPKR